MFSSRVLSFFMFAASIEAFCPNSFSSRQNTAMHLKIEDGKELVAASQKVYRSLEDEDFFDDELFENDDTDDDRVVVTRGDAEVEPSLITAPRGMALAFVKRLFAQPTAAFHPNEAESLDEYSNDEGADDVVYFPIVGFTFVRDGPNHCRALPSVSNPSCRIRGDVCDHVHFGTWSIAK